MSRNRRSRDKGVSLVEASLVTLLIAMVAVASISSLKNRMEAYLWLVTLFIVSPETPLPDGRILTDVWAPRAAFLIFGGFDTPNQADWCQVVLISQVSRLSDYEVIELVTPENIRVCAATPP